MIAAGIIGALAAAIFGLIDWLAIPSGTRAKAVGQWHGLGNLVIVGLFVVSWLLRANAHADPGALAYVFSFVGAGLALVFPWIYFIGGGNARSGICYNIVYPCRR
jgi:uncharacterized membrane protein